MKRLKICYVASSGGHLEEILGLSSLKDGYDSFLITEKTHFKPDVWYETFYMLPAVNRREFLLVYKLLHITIAGLFILLKEKPDIVISTGALMSVPLCMVAKLLRKKLIYIESIARVYTGSATGRFLYRFADLFIVQWESLCSVFPKAVFGGRII